jgi:nucleotide-binding universal stress UspA family protein
MVVTDFSPNSLKAMSPALFLAKPGQGKILLCHVDEEEQVFSAYSSDDLIGFLRDVEARRSAWLESLGNQVRENGLECDIVRLRGYASREIVEYADQQKLDLVVISALGSQGFKQLLAGSTSSNVLRHAQRPLLFVGANCFPKDTYQVKRILYPTVFSPVAREGILWAANLAKTLDAELDVFHVLKIPSYIPALPGEPPVAMPLSVVDSLNVGFEGMLDEVMKEVGIENVSWEVAVGQDEVEEIVSAAVSKKADLIVMPRSPVGVIEGMIFGRMPENVARMSPVPTLLFQP